LAMMGMSFLLLGLLKCHTHGTFSVFSQYTLPLSVDLNSSR
jgi:hypothetical protein